MVVGRGAAAAETGQELLVPADLADRVVVVLEQVADLRPVVEQPSDPGPADQPDTDLDPAGPVHSGEERIRPPPGPQLSVDRLGITLVPRQPPGAREHRQVVMAGQLPDLLDVAGLGLVAVVDPERQLLVRCTPPGDRVGEPVRVGAVGAGDAQHLPGARQHPVGRADHRGGRGRVDQVADLPLAVDTTHRYGEVALRTGSAQRSHDICRGGPGASATRYAGPRPPCGG